jgi:hypothetical protein
MALITQLYVHFASSFQARLAVGLDSSDSSPTDPYGTYGRKSGGIGATCAYQEKPFDRIIRLSKPLDLRNARIDPWQDTTVRGVDLFVGRKYKPAPPGNPLEGRVVSLGEKAKWIEDEGYEIDGMTLSIGPFLTARPTQRVGGYKVGAIPEYKAEYQREKPARIKASQGQMDPLRLWVLTENEATHFDSGAAIFTNNAVSTLSLDPQSLTFTARFGDGSTMDPPANYLWEASLVFSRWDPDALGGQLIGTMSAQHKSTAQMGGSAGKSVPVRPR